MILVSDLGYVSINETLNRSKSKLSQDLQEMFEPKSPVCQCVRNFQGSPCVCVLLCPTVCKVQITTKSYDRMVAPVSAGLDTRQGRGDGRREGD